MPLFNPYMKEMTRTHTTSCTSYLTGVNLHFTTLAKGSLIATVVAGLLPRSVRNDGKVRYYVLYILSTKNTHEGQQWNEII